MTITSWLALYGALVSTIAATLSIRRWLVTGPRLSLSVMARGQAMGGDDTEYLVMTVVNRGDLPTTLSMMAAFQYRSVVHRWLRKSNWAAIVPRPSALGGPGTPHLLPPGTTWMGMANYDDELLKRAQSGKLFLAIHGSHTNRPAIRKVRWQMTPEERIEAENAIRSDRPRMTFARFLSRQQARPDL